LTRLEQMIRNMPVDRKGKESLSVCVSSGLEVLIDSGRLKPGDLLPPTRRLTELLGVSVQVAQEACTRLADRKLVERRKRAGTIVTGRKRTRTLGLLTAIDPSLPQQANVGWVIAQDFMLASERRAYGARHYLCRTVEGRLALPPCLVADIENRTLDAVLVGAVYADIVRQHVRTPVPVFHLEPSESGLTESLTDAVRWLWRQGVKRPALVLELTAAAPRIERDFMSACASFKMKVAPDHVLRDSPSRIEYGKDVYRRLMRTGKPPGGVVIMDDMVGCGFIREVEAHGGPDLSRVIVMTNKGSALHIDARCPQIQIDWGLIVEQAVAQATGESGLTDAARPVYRFCPPCGDES
jgi:DNA-binding transcriptional regulator YhcF (GntR family)